MGYFRAGFDVVGVDLRPQPRYPFTFIQGDALKPPVRLEAFDAIHASPPCQAYSQATAWRGRRSDHPELIDPVRAMLESSGVPFVIENVEAARTKLRNPFMLCGSRFGLPIRRHRYFEATEIPFTLGPTCEHRPTDYSFDHGGKQTETEYRSAMGCEWMTVQESRQAIPPAYTQWIGEQLIGALSS